MLVMNKINNRDAISHIKKTFMSSFLMQTSLFHSQTFSSGKHGRKM